ncbi:hypothetical protein V2W45_1470508 [Cenococcum geophilum]
MNLVIYRKTKLNTNTNNKDDEDYYTIGIEDAINFIKGAEILVSPLLSYKPTLTPPKSTIGNLPPYINCDANTKFSDTIKYHYIILKTNSNTRSDCSINQLTQEVSTCTIPKLPMKKFPTPENASSNSGNDGDDSDSDSDSDSDIDSDSDNHTTCDTLPTRKRKRPPPAHTSNTASKQHPKRAIHSARPLPNRPSALKPTLGARFGSCDTEILHGDDSSDESSEESTTNSSDSVGEESKTAPLTKADEDDEYKVEKILEAHVYRRKL